MATRGSSVGEAMKGEKLSLWCGLSTQAAVEDAGRGSKQHHHSRCTEVFPEIFFVFPRELVSYGPAARVPHERGEMVLWFRGINRWTVWGSFRIEWKMLSSTSTCLLSTSLTQPVVKANTVIPRMNTPCNDISSHPLLAAIIIKAME